ARPEMHLARCASRDAYWAARDVSAEVLDLRPLCQTVTVSRDLQRGLFVRWVAYVSISPVVSTSSGSSPYLSLASGLATSRAHSMKSCATGLIVRSFRRMIPTGAFCGGSLTGSILADSRSPANLNIDRGYIAR